MMVRSSGKKKEFIMEIDELNWAYKLIQILSRTPK